MCDRDGYICKEFLIIFKVLFYTNSATFSFHLIPNLVTYSVVCKSKIHKMYNFSYSTIRRGTQIMDKSSGDTIRYTAQNYDTDDFSNCISSSRLFIISKILYLFFITSICEVFYCQILCCTVLVAVSHWKYGTALM